MAFRTVDEFLALTGKDRPTPAEMRLVEAVTGIVQRERALGGGRGGVGAGPDLRGVVREGVGLKPDLRVARG
jgi:hypothetical protein